MSANAFDKNTSSEGYVDVLVTVVSNAGATINKLFIGETEVVKNSGANWSVSNGVATIKKAYSATLNVGDITFTMTFSSGESVDFTITIKDTTV